MLRDICLAPAGGEPPGEVAMMDAYIFEAGWLFFVAWSLIVAVAVILAFGKDLLPSKSQVKPQAAAGGDRPVHPFVH